MGDIKFSCPKCRGHLIIDERGAGMQAPCSHCGAIIVVPKSTEFPAASPVGRRPTARPADGASPAGEK